MGRDARLNAQTAVDEIAPFILTLPVSKVDKEQRLVTGIATSEVVDKQGEIVDFETAQKFFTNPDLWPGNIREMHQPKAVGKAIAAECDAENKTVAITVKVSKGAPETWEKVLDGTLSMFSIGGSGKRVAEKAAGGAIVKRLFLEQLAEVSLVDNGANPMAKFEIVKSVDGKLADAQPEEPAEEVVVDPVAKATAALDDAAKAAAAPAIDYAGPDKTVPIVTAEDARKAIAGVVLVAGTGSRLALRDAIVKIATSKGEDFVKAITPVAKGCPEPYDIDRALASISMLESLLANEYWDARYSQPSGAAPDPMKVAQVAMLKSAIDATLQFLVSEHQEQFTADPGDANAMVFVTDDAAVELFVKSLDVVQKSGARHSKSDVDMIQKVHDLSGSLGANCHTDDAEKVAKAAAAAKVAADVPLPAPEPSMDAQKLTSELDATKAELVALKATAADQAKADAEVKKRLEALEAQPMPGGPVRSAHAVEKQLGGPGNQPATEHTQVLKVFETLAKDATSDEERLRIATKQMEYRHANGLDHVDMLSGRPVTASA